MDSDELLVAATEVFDRMVTVQYYMSGGGSGYTPMPTVVSLYDAARAQTSLPLTAAAALMLAERVHPGDTVFIGTGFPVPPVMVPEGDGPLGAASLALALEKAFRCRVVLVVDRPLAPMMPEVLRAVGLNVADGDSEFAPHRVRIVTVSSDPDVAREQAQRLIDTYSPKAVITSEKPGPNRLGTIHNGSGIDMTGAVARVDVLTDLCREIGIAVIGIGDGGNEIGMGNIVETVRAVLPPGDKFEGTPGGIATVTKADLLVVATISNWGAYALEAALAILRRNPTILHTPETEERLHQAANNVGLVDPTTCLCDGHVDGIPARYHVNMVAGLNLAVDVRLSQFSRRKMFLDEMQSRDEVQSWVGKFALD